MFRHRREGVEAEEEEVSGEDGEECKDGAAADRGDEEG